MRVLVTGATGFVGKAIVARLIQENFEVFCLASLKSENTNQLANYVKADITNAKSLKKLDELKNIDVIIHSAGLAHQFGEVKKEDFWKTNVEGTKNVANLGSKLKAEHFILISSVSVYGKIRSRAENNLIDESFNCKPVSVYSQSKLESEKSAIEICEKNKIPLTILRLATVIGENDCGNTARLIKLIDRARFIWIGKGNNYKSLIYKRDVTDACLRVLRKKMNRTEIFNVSGEPILMKTIVSEIAEGLNKKIPRIYIPVSILNKIFLINSKFFRIKRIAKFSETFEKWLSDDVFSSAKIALEYGFRAETPVSEAIRRQLKAYKEQK